ncbi:MAG: type 1 glutamine amidotransferase domain-containing protein [Bacteroidota bacterium]|nr:type 1 glutamine amidotransferase domain-containing protein [Bacteroidota bacterium]
MKVLFITTSHDKLGDTDEKTGLWLEELAAPYYIFKDGGAEITVASPIGGRVSLDPKSQSVILATGNTKRFLKDEEAMNFLSHSITLQQVKADDFDLVFLTGGHGSMWDFAGNKIMKELLEAFNNVNKPIAAVSQGVVGLLELKNDKGELLIKGRQLTGFSNSEEESGGLTKVVPFLLETQLLLAGASYSKGADYTSYMVIAGNIITGQNAASSGEVAKKITALAQNNMSSSAFYNLSLVK